jgi:hypothetical protein
MPSASVMHAIVLAVNMPLQEPQPGQAAFSSCVDSVWVILPAKTLPTASKTLLTPIFLPFKLPEAMAPPVTAMVGTFSRAVAMSMPGVILSQLLMSTMPSRRCACIMISTESAISSRDGSE